MLTTDTYARTIVLRFAESRTFAPSVWVAQVPACDSSQLNHVVKKNGTLKN